MVTNFFTDLHSTTSTPVRLLIKTLVVNMERCRFSKTLARQRIIINIPSYELTYFKRAKLFAIECGGGKTLKQNCSFSAPMKYIVFSPYWNVPTSIIQRNFRIGLIITDGMEQSASKTWCQNSLGLVKFLFPNSNAIYLHDTPSKYLLVEKKSL
jgi:murein L,D-transpeptidase YcbB/YkuD